LLPNDTGQQFLALWEEFEQAQSPEAQFAKGIDRLMPLIQNLHNGCQSWLEHDISVQQIFKKNAAIAYTHPLLWDWIQQQITDKAKEVGLRLA